MGPDARRLPPELCATTGGGFRRSPPHSASVAWVAYATVRVVHAEGLLRRRATTTYAVLLAVHLQGLCPGVVAVRPVPARSGGCRTPQLTLPFLLLFRMTCYYYRKAYYRAFWLSPPACAVAEPHRSTPVRRASRCSGQNLHRYFFYAAAIISLINT